MAEKLTITFFQLKDCLPPAEYHPFAFRFPVMGVSYRHTSGNKVAVAFEKLLVRIAAEPPYYTWDLDTPWLFEYKELFKEVPIQAFLTSNHTIARNFARKALKEGIYSVFT